MNDQVKELAQRGMALSAEDRSRLVDLLLESLHESPTNEVEAAWAIEIERRLAAYDSGKIQSVAGDDVFAKARSLAR
ncbi:addiction module protein [Janthinobacterium sp. HH01]|uniref:addiction module protein n=1 Tax=Janthinobacterium sp. HH01 TaxID=1198452 RepID=UPI0005B7FF41|nr:addiction module protein [Janthinobacterium sp. HH01]